MQSALWSESVVFTQGTAQNTCSTLNDPTTLTPRNLPEENSRIHRFSILLVNGLYACYRGETVTGGLSVKISLGLALQTITIQETVTGPCLRISPIGRQQYDG